MFEEKVFRPEPDVFGGAEVRTYQVTFKGLIVFQETFAGTDERFAMEYGAEAFAERLAAALCPGFEF